MSRLSRWSLWAFGVVALSFALLLIFGPSVDSDGSHSVSQPAKPTSSESGSLIVPVAGIARTQLVDSFGDPRGGGERTHQAIDIPAARGTPVVAAAPGLVEKLFESEAGGHTAYVRSSDRRWIYYYAHLDSYAPGLAEGDYVPQGAPIGTVGASGDADPAAPHLHFEIKQMNAGESWHEGRSANPFPLLKK